MVYYILGISNIQPEISIDPEIIILKENARIGLLTYV